MVAAYRTRTDIRSEDAVSHNEGTVFAVDCWAKLDRFLILGVDEPTYYATQQDLLKTNVTAVTECLDTDPKRTLDRVMGISLGGRAPKNEPALYVLALAASHKVAATRSLANGYPYLESIARTGTHLLHLAAYLHDQGTIEPRTSGMKQRDGQPLTRDQISRSHRGFGRSTRRAITRWFESKSPDSLAYQAVKYQSRDGWSFADLQRLSHFSPDRGPKSQALSRWLDKGFEDSQVGRETMFAVPEIVLGFELAKKAKIGIEVAGLVRTAKLPREAVPTQWLNDASVWEALLEDMPIGAMIRNLGKMSSVGLLDSALAAQKVVATITDPAALKKGRVHPIQILSALKVYEQGHGERGKLTWTPNKKVVNALDEAFYLAFGSVRSTGKRIRLAVDVSGSMEGAPVTGLPHIDCRTAAAAMALVTANTEPNAQILAYSHTLTTLPIRPSMRLDEVVRLMATVPFGYTYCRLPIEAALVTGDQFDAFVSYTDSETGDGYAGYGWGSDDAPKMSTLTCDAAIRAYREKTGIPARHAVLAFAANEISVANPADSGQIDMVGLDSAVPGILADFIDGYL